MLQGHNVVMESAPVTRTYARRRRLGEDHHDSTRSGAETLLPAILVHIFAMLPPLELLRLPAVCRAWKRVLRDPASNLLKHVRHTASQAFAITETGFGKAQRSCWVLNHGMTKWIAVDYPFLGNRRSPGFAPGKSIASAASHGGFIFLYVINSEHSNPFVLVWNPVTKSSVGLYSLKGSHPFIFRADEVLLDFVVHEETAMLTAVIDDATQTVQLDYWFHCNTPHSYDPYGTKMAKLELKYEPGKNSADRPWNCYPRSPPYSIFDDNLVDKTFWRKGFYTIFREYSERRPRCSFHLRWSTDGYVPKTAGRADRRESRIVIPFGLVLREHDFDRQGALVVFQDRLFLMVHGCDVHLCNHSGGRCGSEIHVIEVFPHEARAGVQHVKLARMPLRFYNMLFSGDAVNERRRWPRSRAVWGAIPHGDCILFHSWEGLRIVAFRVPAQGERAAGLVGVMDEAQWTSVPSPHTEVAENMHLVSLDLRLDATVPAL